MVLRTTGLAILLLFNLGLARATPCLLCDTGTAKKFLSCMETRILNAKPAVEVKLNNPDFVVDLEEIAQSVIAALAPLKKMPDHMKANIMANTLSAEYSGVLADTKGGGALVNVLLESANQCAEDKSYINNLILEEMLLSVPKMYKMQTQFSDNKPSSPSLNILNGNGLTSQTQASAGAASSVTAQAPQQQKISNFPALLNFPLFRRDPKAPQTNNGGPGLQTAPLLTQKNQPIANVGPLSQNTAPSPLQSKPNLINLQKGTVPDPSLQNPKPAFKPQLNFQPKQYPSTRSTLPLQISPNTNSGKTATVSEASSSSTASTGANSYPGFFYPGRQIDPGFYPRPGFQLPASSSAFSKASSASSSQSKNFDVPPSIIPGQPGFLFRRPPTDPLYFPGYKGGFTSSSSSSSQASGAANKPGFQFPRFPNFDPQKYPAGQPNFRPFLPSLSTATSSSSTTASTSESSKPVLQPGLQVPSDPISLPQNPDPSANLPISTIDIQPLNQIATPEIQKEETVQNPNEEILVVNEPQIAPQDEPLASGTELNVPITIAAADNKPSPEDIKKIAIEFAEVVLVTLMQGEQGIFTDYLHEDIQKDQALSLIISATTQALKKVGLEHLIEALLPSIEKHFGSLPEKPEPVMYAEIMSKCLMKLFFKQGLLDSKSQQMGKKIAIEILLGLKQTGPTENKLDPLLQLDQQSLPVLSENQPQITDISNEGQPQEQEILPQEVSPELLQSPETINVLDQQPTDEVQPQQVPLQVDELSPELLEKPDTLSLLDQQPTDGQPQEVPLQGEQVSPELLKNTETISGQDQQPTDLLITKELGNKPLLDLNNQPPQDVPLEPSFDPLQQSPQGLEELSPELQEEPLTDPVPQQLPINTVEQQPTIDAPTPQNNKLINLLLNLRKKQNPQDLNTDPVPQSVVPLDEGEPSQPLQILSQPEQQEPRSLKPNTKKLFDLFPRLRSKNKIPQEPNTDPTLSVVPSLDIGEEPSQPLQIQDLPLQNNNPNVPNIQQPSVSAISQPEQQQPSSLKPNKNKIFDLFAKLRSKNKIPQEPNTDPTLSVVPSLDTGEEPSQPLQIQALPLQNNNPNIQNIPQQPSVDPLSQPQEKPSNSLFSLISSWFKKSNPQEKEVQDSEQVPISTKPLNLDNNDPLIPNIPDSQEPVEECDGNEPNQPELLPSPELQEPVNGQLNGFPGFNPYSQLPLLQSQNPSQKIPEAQFGRPNFPFMYQPFSLQPQSQLPSNFQPGMQLPSEPQQNTPNLVLNVDEPAPANYKPDNFEAIDEPTPENLDLSNLQLQEGPDKILNVDEPNSEKGLNIEEPAQQRQKKIPSLLTFLFPRKQSKPNVQPLDPNEPSQILEQQPQIQNEQPQLFDEQPELLNLELQQFDEQPQIYDPEPDLVHLPPQIFDQGPGLLDQESPLSVGQPDILDEPQPLNPQEEQLQPLDLQLNPQEEQLQPLDIKLSPQEEQLQPLDLQLNPQEKQLQPLDLQLNPQEQQLQPQISEPQVDTIEQPADLLSETSGQPKIGGDQIDVVKKIMEAAEAGIKPEGYDKAPLVNVLTQIVQVKLKGATDSSAAKIFLELFPEILVALTQVIQKYAMLSKQKAPAMQFPRAGVGIPYGTSYPAANINNFPRQQPLGIGLGNFQLNSQLQQILNKNHQGGQGLQNKNFLIPQDLGVRTQQAFALGNSPFLGPRTQQGLNLGTSQGLNSGNLLGHKLGNLQGLNQGNLNGFKQGNPQGLNTNLNGQGISGNLLGISGGSNLLGNSGLNSNLNRQGSNLLGSTGGSGGVLGLNKGGAVNLNSGGNLQGTNLGTNL